MYKITDVLSITQPEKPIYTYTITIHTDDHMQLFASIDSVEAGLESKIQEEFVSFIENIEHHESFLLIDSEAIKLKKIVYVKIDRRTYLNF
ncbi:hypothetical protein LKL81_24260 [Bacillus paranthracis]|uniref:hypothetical protein n=1 Tax=Bacillus TaxID=1386 RepID=UPI00027A33DE|nr:MULTISPECIES: hypothetical protein [Bacillus]EJR17890.1 hypothetical protein II9_02092 [Bacillus cereus MSX-D12]KMP40160.1 hypothetical protein TU55_24245 [Bacillus cereus]KMP67175.1 hypothetical protein TU61_12965 [Bacillus cereus]MCC2374077.1 hypothetical protein [Bacillus paranthracis]MCC2430333.1 hypothetical protein [Bacillus paranthracis]